ncbi:YafY family transcriptional regulator [Brucepastera parasyntrophica]|uniref:helix-turn-helix transcriptional regulator n=1 Tax=Brucepastera parasyntrophica TaxID=2880008 RepID=UPI00210E7E9C|nr:YafY family protein [Brucepastera parasyntrophica]ULQ58891.1 YafY family transcriptional regulator [Brucepastera parasyntrophica]
MQIHRLFQIVYILLGQEQTTAAELAEKLEVSVRTIYRDIEILSGAGIPLYGLQGKGGGIRLMDTFTLDRSFFSESEQNEILYALRSLQATGAADESSVIEKIGGLFRKTGTNWIEIDFSPWSTGFGTHEIFTLLKNAIFGQKEITFTYYNTSGEKTGRTAIPVKLFFKSRSWYVYAFCTTRQDWRFFKISRMKDISVLPEKPAGRVPSVPRFENEEKIPYTEVRLELLFKAECAFRVYDEFDPLSVTQLADGSLRVSVAFPDDSWVCSYLLSYGDSVTVLSPEHIAARLLEQAEKVSEKYKNISET